MIGSQGERGEPGAPGFAPEPLPTEERGLVGTVIDPSGQRVSNGTVFLVPAADVAALADEPIDLTLAPGQVEMLGHDEPLEDLLDRNAARYTSAVIDSGGRYRFPTLDSGRYFVVYRPAEGDSEHLPGGSACRTALDSASLTGARLDLRVSGRPTDAAMYVGSSTCFACHGRHRITRTAHRVALRVPARSSAFQDATPWASIDEALRAFEEATTLYYYDCDTARAGDAKCRVSDTDPSLATPATVVQFEARLARDSSREVGESGAYTIELANRRGVGSVRYAVDLTYGGAVSKQSYITRRSNSNDTVSHYLLPLQYNIRGRAESPAATDWPFRDYYADHWYDFAAGTLREPGNSLSFDNNCAGCHLTGMRLTGSPAAGFNAHAVTDPAGDYDYDGDGRLDEINSGCENCHGPGSEHVDATEIRGRHIVSPSLLTPERDVMICGRCHSRPAGIGGGATEAALSAEGLMPRAGVRRSEFAAGFTTRVDAAPGHLFSSGDSRSNHQQYTDFIRTTMYRNDSVLMTCSSCHDAHGDDEHPHMLHDAPDDNAACTGCHAGPEFTAPRGHVEQVTGFVHDGTEEQFFVCTSCHMPRTVASGARQPELLDGIPAGATPVQYYHGDIASHRFAVAPMSAAQEQPVAATLTCGFCHGAELPNP